MTSTLACLGSSLQPSFAGRLSNWEGQSTNQSQSSTYLPVGSKTVLKDLSAYPSSQTFSRGTVSKELSSQRDNVFACRSSVSAKSGQHTESSKGGPSDGPATPFHLAFPVNDLEATRDFYGKILGCPEGRSADTWIDYNLFGHQIVCHLIPGYNGSATANPVDGDPVPVPHFGLAMSKRDFHELAERVRTAGIEFVIEPHIRFKGAPGEQWTMFFRDPSGNSLEFKAMTNPSNLFAKYKVDE